MKSLLKYTKIYCKRTKGGVSYMKLAEALIERAELQKKNAQLFNRITSNVMVQEGDTPAEKPEELIAEYEQNMKRLLFLVQKINKTNDTTPFSNGTVADAIAQRDNLRTKISTYRSVYEAATIRPDRYSQKEVKFVRCIDAKALQHTINELSKQYREIDTKLQGINWTVDLIEM